MKDYFYLIIIGLLLVLTLAERCHPAPSPPPSPQVRHDTVWRTKDSLVYSKPRLVRVLLPGKHDTLYLADTISLEALKKDYRRLLTLYLSKNIQKDSIRVDTLGYVSIRDTVSRNLIQGRSLAYHLRYPLVRETLSSPGRTQLYLGGSIQGDLLYPVERITAGVLLKNRQDQIFGLNTGLTREGRPVFGISSFWKLSLKKRP